MQAETFTENTRISPDGQITIPKNIREVLGVSNGDRITFVVDGNNVIIANSFAYALRKFQKEMEGEAERVGWKSEEDVVAFIKEIRSEIYKNV